MEQWKELIFSDTVPFGEKVKRIYDYQRRENSVYGRFCEALGDTGGHCPLLPVEAFRDAEVVTGDREAELTFRSSGTGGMDRSVHHLADTSLYRESLLQGFRNFYDLENSVIWACTPGYSDNPHSSLIWMLRELVESTESEWSGFLPEDEPLDPEKVGEVAESGRRLILFGAAFGLLDLVEKGPVSLPTDSLVIETGGMKTHRREIGRGELHRRLSTGFGIDRQNVHSEYGMAELLSQAYATGGRWFRTVPWMEVSIRNPENPLEVQPPGREGLIGVIDLANVHSCAFLLTGDRGVADRGGRFQVLGRWNPLDMRGCNFLIDRD